MSTIANAAGISAGAPYSHVGGKKGLYLSTVRATLEVTSNTLSPVSSDGAPIPIEAALERTRRAVRDNPDFLRLLAIGLLAREEHPEAAALIDGWLDLWRQQWAELLELRGLDAREATTRAALFADWLLGAALRGGSIDVDVGARLLEL